MTERTANEALAASARAVAIEGRNFRTPGKVHAYRKPSLFARILRALSF